MQINCVRGSLRQPKDTSFCFCGGWGFLEKKVYLRVALTLLIYFAKQVLIMVDPLRYLLFQPVLHN